MSMAVLTDEPRLDDTASATRVDSLSLYLREIGRHPLPCRSDELHLARAADAAGGLIQDDLRAGPEIALGAYPRLRPTRLAA